MKPSARLLKILATASLPRDVVALHASTFARMVRRSLRPFEIDTEVLSWNEHDFYVRHTFRSSADPGCVIGTAYLTLSFPDDTAAPAAMVRMATGDDVIPPLLDNATRARFGLAVLPTTLAPSAAR